MTQEQVLLIVASKGSYTAELDVRENGRTVGMREVSPAQKLVKKGFLTLQKTREISRMSSMYGNSDVTEFTWVVNKDAIAL